MPRGKAAPDGATYVAANGYHYTKDNGRYRLTHHLVMEEQIGRPLEPGEMVRFKDGDRSNRDPSNLELVPKGGVSKGKQAAALRVRIDDLLAKLKTLES